MPFMCNQKISKHEESSSRERETCTRCVLCNIVWRFWGNEYQHQRQKHDLDLSMGWVEWCYFLLRGWGRIWRVWGLCFRYSISVTLEYEACVSCPSWTISPNQKLSSLVTLSIVNTAASDLVHVNWFHIKYKRLIFLGQAILCHIWKIVPISENLKGFLHVGPIISSVFECIGTYVSLCIL